MTIKVKITSCNILNDLCIEINKHTKRLHLKHVRLFLWKNTNLRTISNYSDILSHEIDSMV